MKLKDFSKEMVDEHSFIEMAFILLNENGKDTNLYDMIDEFKRIGNYKDSEIENRILQFYTDLNTDGRFLSVGENIWGLRDWYSVDDIEEKIAPTIQKFTVLDEDEDLDITLLGEEDKTKDVDITIAQDDQEGLNDPEDPEDEEVEDELDEAGLVVEVDEEDEDEEEEEEEL
ncbi:DNA-directed RNA polymerase subunit delta [Mammaliicoccus stepanovicii]|uniref:Probable DNA-directed RNA polymerase subunit delta n=1 Tax=Mammaliicoccus stepanovicii TaxID=643214 RepID=A0A239YMH3_9STAP|nr:DNA-directed RNA polymerase subunit delta [Mammaliicoccus stepanovicii]PNZ78903.1 DNA-directed RNA polymerase subunit delta [Mammaliicoccus stepanovicii]GGI41201.1 putative DNA-directed RNA polymerase subunit delta [Mammaliicoccus stepanovicii]SNV60185.1 DNA-directed RNA polymerase delta subunit [Mammaliicoccus stepanovicii]